MRHTVAPTRRFSEYVLTANRTHTGGLTSVPIEQFTKIIDHTQSEIYVELGFTFYHNDVYAGDLQYEHIVVSPLGFVILVDPGQSSTTASAITARVLTKRNASWAIIDSATTSDVLLCPWFCGQFVQVDDVYSLPGAEYTGAQKLAIEQGITAPPYLLNEKTGGVWIKKADRSPEGLRTIIRWYTAQQPWFYTGGSTPEYTVTTVFECVIYENGKIEFRYAPPTEMKDPETGSTFFSASYAACGVFPGDQYMTGSRHLWRDFSTVTKTSRASSQYGGASYLSTFAEPDTYGNTTSYVHTLQVSEHWFATRMHGATLTFAPPAVRGEFLPRQMLRKLDAMSGGSEQDESFAPYNDVVSLAKTSGVVNYPTRVNRFAFGETEISTTIQGVFGDGEFNVTSSVSPTDVADYVNYCSSVGTTTPYSEDRQFTLGDVTSSFWMTGSKESIIGAGYNQPLRDKTQIRLAFPIKNKTAFYDVSGSVMYYNHKLQTFQVVSPSDVRNALPLNWDIDPEDWWEHGHSCRMFSPICTSITSGNFRTAYNDPSADGGSLTYVLGALNKEHLYNGWQWQFKKDALTHENYVPDECQTFNLPIDRPFLIEKIVVELPLEAGAGWFNDRTRFMPRAAGNVVGCNLHHRMFTDFGGPALTFSVLNSMKKVVSPSFLIATRDIVASASIDHSNDITSSIDPITIFEDSNSTPCLVRTGFSQFGTPAGIVVPTSNLTFTGSVTFAMESAVSNGALLYMTGTLTSEAMADAAVLKSMLTNLYCSKKLNIANTNNGMFAVTVAHVNPLQRDNCGFITYNGKSPMGKTFVTPLSMTDETQSFIVKNPFYVADTYDEVPSHLTTGSFWTSELQIGSGPFCVIPFEYNSPSPYVVTGNDDLVLAISKVRPCISATYDPDTQFTEYEYFTHHDVKISTGTMYVTIYGSYVRENKELHDVNVRVNDSKAVHAQTLCADPILDQFLVEPAYLDVGTYTDDAMSGTMVTRITDGGTTTLLTGTRELSFSRLTGFMTDADVLVDADSREMAQYGTIASFCGCTRLAKTIAPNERFYDSMLPKLNELVRAGGASIVSFDNVRYPVAGYVFLDDYTPFFGYVMPTLHGWYRSFPFAEKYASVTRTKDFTKSYVATSKYVSPTTLTTIDPLHFNDVVVYTVSTPYEGMTRYYNDPPYVSTVIKMMFGIGDIYGYQYNKYCIGSGTNNAVDLEYMYDVIDNTYGITNVKVRGWKYGIYNGFPTYSSIIWRPDHFGHNRDMLEQRLDTKFYNENSTVFSAGDSKQQSLRDAPVKIRFVDKDGTNVAPDATWSSNLSFEATSSLPYFDGEARNRPAIVVSAMNTSVVQLTTDEFGNFTVT